MTQRSKYKHKDYFVWRDAFQYLAIDQGVTLPEMVELNFVIPFPKSYSQKKRQKLEGKPHRSKPDLDNLIKAVLDTLSKDDKNVHKINASKTWGEIGSIEIKEIQA